MATQQRRVFFISDRTAITAETLGNSLLTQFETVSFITHTERYVDSAEKATDIVAKINRYADEDQVPPLVFCTLLDTTVQTILRTCRGVMLDFFEAFIVPLERELQVSSNHTVGRSHGMNDIREYSERIDAINFTLNHDDGSTVSHLQDADIILVGISRTGKTPTCLYLSLHYGIRAANFPLTEDDLEQLRLPQSLEPFKHKLFGLTLDAKRLQQIRQERLPNSRYASLAQCEYEIRQAEALFRKFNVPYVRSTLKSIEEIATGIIDLAHLQPRQNTYRRRDSDPSTTNHLKGVSP